MNTRIWDFIPKVYSFFKKDLILTFIILFLTINLFSTMTHAHERLEDQHNIPIHYKMARVQIPFITNEGQVDPEVRFYAQTFIGTAFITKKGEIIYTLLNKKDESLDNCTAIQVLKEQFINTRATTMITGEGKSPTRINYYKSTNPRNWKQNIPSYDTVCFGEVYECIHLKLAAYGNNVEKLFYVKPGGRVEDIRVSIDGAQELKTNNKGGLIAITKYGPIGFTPPIAYQEIHGKRISICVSYTVSGNKYGFTVGTYDKVATLVIDPLLTSTYLGGSKDDYGYAMAVYMDDVYVAGKTKSTSFPGTPASARINDDVLIAQLNADLSTLSAVTIFGGNDGSDFALDIAIGNDSIYLTGRANSSDFPNIGNGYSNTGPTFIAKLSMGLNLQVTTRFVCNNVYGLALDNSGNVFIAGATLSLLPKTGSDTPGDTSDDTYQISKKGSGDGFIAKFSANLHDLYSGTYLGGNEQGPSADIIYNIITDIGDVLVAGVTTSNNFPTTSGCYDNSYAHTPGDSFYWNDVFVSKLSNDLKILKASTYLGGVREDSIHGGNYGFGGHRLLVDGGTILVAGETISSDFPADTTIGPAAGKDAFIARFNNDLSSLEESTRLGGENNDSIHTMIASGGEVYVSGRTYSDNFPTTLDAYKTSPVAGYDGGFIARFSSSLGALTASTLLGGKLEDVMGIAVDISGRVVISGHLQNQDYPTTQGAYQTALAGDYDLFISKFTTDLSGAQISVDITDHDFGGVLLGKSISTDITVSNIGTVAINITNISFTGTSSSDFTYTGNCTSVIPPSASCIINVTFTPSGIGTKLATLRVESDDSINPTIDITLQGVGALGPTISIAPDSLNFGNVTVLESSSPQSVTVSNTGSLDLSIQGITLTGPSDFSMSHDCPDTLSAYTSCTITTTFTPSSTENKNATITITSDADQPSIDVPLTGVGEGPSISVISYALIKAWPDEPDSKTLIVTNKGNLPLSIWGYNLQGPDINDFKFGKPSNCGDNVLQPSEICSITVDYKPEVPANPSDFVKLIISSNDPVNPAAEVQIEGTTPDIVTENVNMQAGWSLIALPVIPIPNERSRDSTSLFPDAAAIYEYDKDFGYILMTNEKEMERGKGYWIFLNEAKSFALTGYTTTNFTFQVNEDGWHMIGGCLYAAKVSSINCAIETIYGYKPGFGYKRVLESENLEPGIGYWILLKNVIDQAEIIIQATESGL